MELKTASFWQEFIPKSYIFLKNKYSWNFFKSDLIAGTTVGIVALPLAMAFAIASGVGPEKGIYTAIIAGFITSLLGGSRFQIAGPTGAFVVILYSIIQREGYQGLVLASFLAGLVLLICAFCRLGTLIKYIPYPLVIGFTSGIAVMIFSSQIKDFLGLQIESLPADFFPKWKILLQALPTMDLFTVATSTGTLLLILGIRRWIPVIPWGIASVSIVTMISYGFHWPVETIATRFGEISSSFPSPSFPSFLNIHWKSVIPDALTIAFLAGIESLLSAVVADGMSGAHHKSNCELMAQGVSNICSPLFGGIPSTGAIARTATNIKTGAKTPLSGMIHSVVLLLILWFLAPVVSQIPLGALAAVLMMVSWNMSELHRFRHLLKAPICDISVLLTAFILTIVVDLTVAVEVGVVLAAFLFMKRMGEKSGVIAFSDAEEEDIKAISLPKGVEVYDVFGPFFFGVTDRLKSVLSNLEYPPKVFILRMHKVPFIDASGMQALREFFYDCERDGTKLYLSCVEKSLMKSLRKFGVIDLLGEKSVFLTFKKALESANSNLKCTR